MIRSLSDKIKAALPIEDEFRRDGHELRKVGSRLVCLCPFHQERTPSCYVTPETGRFRCFGSCGGEGTIIDYYSRKCGITPGEAIAELALRLRLPQSNGDGKHVNPSAKIKQKKSTVRRALPKLPDVQRGTIADLSLLAKNRNISLKAIQLASDRGFLFFCDMKDGPNAVRAWILTDRTHRNSQARRLDGEAWKHVWDYDLKRWVRAELGYEPKVRGFKYNWGKWPVGIEEARRAKCIALVEGAPDFLAAFHFLIAEGRADFVAPVAMLGSSNDLAIEALPMFTGKRVRIFPHNDSNHAGLKAATDWETQLRPAAASVDAFDFTGLKQIGGSAVKDLNDLTSIDSDCFESEPELRALMDF